MSTNTTRLTTPRLILRTWTADEATTVTRGARAPQWADDFPSEGDHLIAGFITEHPGTTLGEYGQRLIIERGSGQVIGAIGLFWPPAGGVLEIGYGIVASRRGRGYATEATRAMTEHALTAPGVHTVTAGVDLTNPASARVLDKCGFHHWTTEDQTARYRFIRT
ncbi:GNAT family N-acetyltransferase [Spirillospora sp. NPDC047279]|uniref:GNAT family N-acetyltransferase n=1 Tax=Spirillospora sp. NPDC047279 TaxID=3155478 RepID=UPI0033F1DE72